MNLAQRIHWLAASIVVSPEKYGQQLENFVGGRNSRSRQLAAFFSPQDPITLITEDLGPVTLKSLIGLIGASFGPFVVDAEVAEWGDSSRNEGINASWATDTTAGIFTRQGRRAGAGDAGIGR